MWPVSPSTILVRKRVLGFINTFICVWNVSPRCIRHWESSLLTAIGDSVERVYKKVFRLSRVFWFEVMCTI